MAVQRVFWAVTGHFERAQGTILTKIYTKETKKIIIALMVLTN